MKIIAPAKLNLYLHITGRRDDGYHFLDSLFAFTKFGDEITIIPSNITTLTMDGVFSTNLIIENNLILRAANLLKEKYNISDGAHIHLTKKIPVAAGLGGGSSDAAAVLNGLNQFWKLNLSHETLAEIGKMLGADIPACIYQKTALVSGIGEIIEPIPLNLDSMIILLINPNLPLSTQSVFKTYKNFHQPFSKIAKRSVFKKNTGHENFLTHLTHTQNDLEPAAIHLLPTIDDLLQSLKKQDSCLFARMSGSGPTCFAIFTDQHAAEIALNKMQKEFPNSWLKLTGFY